MVNQILEYENFLASDLRYDMTPEGFLELHTRMVSAFQHERLVHLIITLFFGFLTILACVGCGVLTVLYGFDLWLLPMYLLAVILLVLELFYIRHYYFLENHVQDMYVVWYN